MADLQILRGTSVTVTETFMVDAAPSDLDSGVPAVVALFPDGTALSPAPVASGAWTGRTTGQYRIVLDPQPEVTYLDPVTWTGTIGGKAQTLRSRVEWVGEFLFTLAETRAVDGSVITTAIASDQQILNKRASIADRLQRVCGVSFFPRFAREIHNGDGSWQLRLKHRRASKLLSITVGGAVKSVGDYTLHDSGILEATSNYAASGMFTAGRGNVTVEYVHGWDQVPGPVHGAALKIARVQLVPSNIGDRATSIATDQGTIFLSTAGRGTFQPFGIPEVDAALREFKVSPVG